MTLKLYLVRGNDVEGENSDLFVVAENTDRATDIWNDYMIVNGWPRNENDEEEALPRKTTVDPANIREILPDVTGTRYAGAERGIDWDSLDIVFESA